MNALGKITSLAVVLGGWLVLAGAVQAPVRTADAIVKELENVQLPTFDYQKQRDDAYFMEFVAKRSLAAEKRAALILELYKAAPLHEQIPALLQERWSCLAPVDAERDALQKEIALVLARTSSAKLKIEGTYIKAWIKVLEGGSTGAPDVGAVDEFIRLAPGDARGAQLLYRASRLLRDEHAKRAVEDRIIKEFRDSSLALLIEGGRRQRDALGKPFDLEFTDAIAGSRVSIKGLKGKVVVVDFWATWCLPWAALLPQLKELYAKYHDKGVEFIGVSLDRTPEKGGLVALKAFVKEHDIRWPQYYQGKGWESPFSKGWGVQAIPAIFVIDREGKLHSVDAQHELGTMLPELLGAKSPAAGAATGRN